jgi:hypothetical protein
MAFVVVLAGAYPAPAQMLTPPDTPFGWAAGAGNSVAYHWNNFALGGTYPGPFTPDQALFGPGLPAATLTETTGTAFLTGGGNIYAPSTAIAVSATIPNYALSTGPGGAHQTTVFLQTRTLGSEIDYAGLTLSWTQGAGLMSMTPASANYFQELERAPLGGFGGFSVTRIWGFDVPFNPGEFVVTFAGAASSVSLDQFRVDTFTTPVPEPSALVLLGAAAAVAWRRRTRR